MHVTALGAPSQREPRFPGIPDNATARCCGTWERMRPLMASNRTVRFLVFGLVALLGAVAGTQAATDGAAQYHKQIEPILNEYCSDCHLDGMKKGGVALDQFKSDKDLLENRELW